MGLSFIPLGVGDAYSAEHYSACVAVGAEGRWLLVDCPHPIRKVLREASRASGADLDVGTFDAVAITHVHADHASGLEGFGFYSHFVLSRRARIAAHPRVTAGLWEGRLAGGMEAVTDRATQARKKMGFGDYFDVTSLAEEGPVRVGPFEISCRETRHLVPTYALRIQAGGRSIAFSADTPFDAGLVAWLAEADVVLHETGTSRVHTPYEALAALPDPVRSRLRLIHYPDAFDVKGSAIEALAQGRRYEIP